MCRDSRSMLFAADGDVMPRVPSIEVGPLPMLQFARLAVLTLTVWGASCVGSLGAPTRTCAMPKTRYSEI